tara:strand:- start:1080 stop:1253 length:174 start_codon:yes stop_codon:yes gene_type:complete
MTKFFKFTTIIDTDMDEPEAWDKLIDYIALGVDKTELTWVEFIRDIFEVEQLEDEPQ